MRCLIVLAHPLSDSLNARLADFVRNSLAEAGHQVDWLDLYADGYDPRLTAEERRRIGMAAPFQIADERIRQIADAETIVLVFPTWWFAMPAILKGWIDRSFVPGIAYHDDGKGGPIRPCTGDAPALRRCHHAWLALVAGADRDARTAAPHAAARPCAGLRPAGDLPHALALLPPRRPAKRGSPPSRHGSARLFPNEKARIAPGLFGLISGPSP